MKFTHDHALRIDEIITQAAAVEIMPRFQRLAERTVREKTSPFDLVTDADEASERSIAAALQRSFPSALIVGEETAARDPRILEEIAAAELAFIVDPIDGTKNFTSGLPLFGVVVAATIRGEVALGAVHDPVCRDTALALRGEGAWMQANGRVKATLQVAKPVDVSEMDAIAGTNFLPHPLREKVTKNLSRLGMHAWLRCSAHEYRMAASGHCHLLFYNKLMPWDHAAGWLLHREAGGYSAHFDGTAYLPSHLTGGLICATDQESWRLAREALLAG